MGEKSLEDRIYSVEEYLELLKNSEVKLSYDNGKVYAMAGGKPNHSRIINNAQFALTSAFLNKDCSVFNSDLGVYIEQYKNYTYPDITVACDNEDYERDLFLKNPKIIIEVASKGTEKYDRDEKMLKYLSIPSLLEYVIIRTEKPIVVVHSRGESGAFEISGAIGIDSSVYLPNFSVKLAMRDLYRRVKGMGEEI